MNRFEVERSIFNEMLKGSSHIVVVQADNPDADSLASALALEELLGNIDKQVTLYCAIDIPEYLKYLDGWDRVVKDLPNSFDMVILVDCGFKSLLDTTYARYGQNAFPKEKLALLDHHGLSPHDIPATLDINDESAVATGEIIYELATGLGWDITLLSANYLSQSILADTLGLTSEALLGQPRAFEIMADLVRIGIDLAALQEKRLQHNKMSPELFYYRASLLSRVKFFADSRLALITIPYEELKAHSHDYNPTVVLDDTRQVEGVALSVGLKQYVSQGKLVRVTGRIRCSRGVNIADKLAMSFGEGGGHPYAAGFKIEGPNLDFDDIKSRLIARTVELLDN